jgi:voltage-gated potassium channel
MKAMADGVERSTGAVAQELPSAETAARGRGSRLRTPAWAAWHGIQPAVTASHVRLWLIAVVSVVLVGTAGYALLLRWSVSDALYMTVITLTTVGFREVGELGELGRGWTMLLALAGVALLFGFVGIVGETLVTEATSGRREARRMQQAVSELRDHFVLCGYGRVGTTVARQLRAAGQRVVVIDVRGDSLERARREGHFVVEGDATEDATLREAGIERARGLITTIDSDALNVYVILSARTLNPKMLICGRASTTSAEGKLTQAGADRVVSPYTMAGLRLSQLALRPHVVEFLEAAMEQGERAFSIEELDVTPGGPLEARTVRELREQGIFVLAMAHAEGGYEPHPPDQRRLEADETVIVSGSVESLGRLRRPEAG